MTSAWTGERVRLRAIEPADWSAFQEYDENSEDQSNGDHLTPPRSAERARQWAKEQAEKDQGADLLRLAIAERESGRLVGTVNTHAVDPHNGTFEYGVAVGRAHQRRGYAAEAIVILLRYMFGERRFQKCDVTVYAANEGSLALHRRLGFTEEGRRRRGRYYRGRYDDIVLFGITVEEFAERHGLG
ncbi:GNAT family N-acetyltransferase [Nonomuraea sp. NPDC050790]|uniref:GNAT family N-acetyltransferase n=1 Tax=Nonomuraea sp. NPDC050790 TaxID=3364371 RepID=UPI00379AAFCF